HRLRFAHDGGIGALLFNRHRPRRRRCSETTAPDIAWTFFRRERHIGSAGFCRSSLSVSTVDWRDTLRRVPSFRRPPAFANLPVRSGRRGDTLVLWRARTFGAAGRAALSRITKQKRDGPCDPPPP